MTLTDLIRKAQSVGNQFSTSDIPLVDWALVEIQDVQFDVKQDKKGQYYIQMTEKYSLEKPITNALQEAALALVDAVERYVSPTKGQFCHRTELLSKCSQLKELLK